MIEEFTASFIRGLLRSAILHAGAGARYLCVKLLCRRKVSYKEIRYGHHDDNQLNRFDNSFANGVIGIVLLGLLIAGLFNIQ
ncbi:MAG: hypothetical protein K2L49_03080 [Muribaculaceae bacterium]|nr:hypothetical protein [Muribaculaceae bacterium]